MAYRRCRMFLSTIPVVINPNDIESITILKDVGATAIYGGRAANGVIIINTQKAAFNKQLKVSFRHHLTISEMPKVKAIPLLLSPDYISVEETLFRNGDFRNFINAENQPSEIVSQLLRLGSNPPDHQYDSIRNLLSQQDIRHVLGTYYYRPSVNQAYALTLSGGQKTLGYRITGGYDRNMFNEKGNDYRRITAGGKLLYRKNKMEIATEGVLSANKAALNFPGLPIKQPYTRVKDPQNNNIAIPWQHSENYLKQDSGLLNESYVPLDELDYSDKTNNLDYWMANTQINYFITSWLNLNLLYQHSQYQNLVKDLKTKDTWLSRYTANNYAEVLPDTIIWRMPHENILDQYLAETRSHNGRIQLNVAKKWGRKISSAGKDTSYRNELFGYAGSEIFSTGMDIDVTRTDENGKSFPSIKSIPPIDTTADSTDHYFSSYMNMFYTWNKKITASFSIRKDQSNRYSVRTNNTGAPLWSVGTVIHAYKFMHHSENWPIISIRGSFGEIGNTNSHLIPLTIIRQVNTNSLGMPVSVIENQGNTILGWEKMRTANIGIDFRTRDNAISFTIDGYIKKNYDLFSFNKANPTSGLGEVTGNHSSMKGRGLEIVLHTNCGKGDLTWETDSWVSVSNSKVQYDGIPTTTAWEYMAFPQQHLLSGDAPNEIKAFQLATLDSGRLVAYLDGIPGKNYEAIATANPSTLKSMGSATPTVYGVFRNALSYKGCKLSFDISAKFGYSFRSKSFNPFDVLKGEPVHEDYVNRWQALGDEKHTYVPAFEGQADKWKERVYQFGDKLVKPGDHVRLQRIQLFYTLNKKLIPFYKITNAEIGLSVYNVGILWRANDIHADPDLYAYAIPVPRSFSFSLFIDFAPALKK